MSVALYLSTENLSSDQDVGSFLKLKSRSKWQSSTGKKRVPGSTPGAD